MKFVVPFLKWIARAFSLVSIAAIAMTFREQDYFAANMSFEEITLLILFPFGVVFGMLIAWKWEGMGGMITILSVISFYICDYIFFGIFPPGNEYLKLSSPGVVFILYSFITYNSRHRNNYI